MHIAVACAFCSVFIRVKKTDSEVQNQFFYFNLRCIKFSYYSGRERRRSISVGVLLKREAISLIVHPSRLSARIVSLS